MELSPFLILFVGIAIVVGLIIGARLNAFLALITAAIVVSLLSPGEIADKIARVAKAFGDTAGGIGIVIGLVFAIVTVCFCWCRKNMERHRTYCVYNSIQMRCV